MYIKSSICGIQYTCIKFLIFHIFTKIECWPVFKQDPLLVGLAIPGRENIENKQKLKC